MPPTHFIETQKVNCKDCHRCVRYCPVKAIGMQDGYAHIVADKCILCGRCVVECPQKAKLPLSQLGAVQQALREKKQVILSIAPSFPVSFPHYSSEQFWAALHHLGFAIVEETAAGAEIVSQMYRTQMEAAKRTVISSCCPVIINLIKKYYPQLIEQIATVVSPMVVHGKMLKQQYGQNAFVVFAGPCIAKMAESNQANGASDAVISFSELYSWLQTIDLSNAAAPAILPSPPTPPSGKTRYYPITGGVLTSFMDYLPTDPEIITVDGLEKCKEVLEGLLAQELNPRFIEAMACDGGCIGGPLHEQKSCISARRAKLIDFARKNAAQTLRPIPSSIDFSKQHTAEPVVAALPAEEEIIEILASMGKYSLNDEKNCGACGYDSCRLKAAAIYQGLAEIDMCVPYMRSKAESFANLIVYHSINAIIVVDENMVVQEFNPMAEKLFEIKKDFIKGKQLSEFMSCTHFVHVIHTGRSFWESRVEYPQYGLIMKQQIIQVPKHGLIIGVFRDITEEEKTLREMEIIKMNTIEKATEIINKQMHVAQEIAGLLGETTAETKSALLELIHALKNKEGT